MEILLKGLNCAVCSAKIQKEINDFPEVKKADFNLMTHELKVIFNNDNVDSEAFFTKVEKTVHYYEPDVKVLPQKSGRATNSDRVLSVTLEGLNCAVCSAKISEEINTFTEVDHAEFNIMTHELRINLKEKNDTKRLIEKIEKTVHYYEPDVNVIYTAEKDIQSKPQTNKSIFGFIKKNVSELIGIAVFAGALVLDKYQIINNNLWISFIYIAAYLLIGGDVLLKSAKNILKGKVFDENFLMSVATVGAMGLGDFVESAAVMLFYKIGESLSDYAQDKSIDSINSLLKLKIPYANLITADGTKQIQCEDIRQGDLLLVKAGEQVPADGIVVKGEGYVDTKSITGEPVARSVKEGTEVFGGYIVTDGPVTVKATKTFENSMISKIIYLTKEASQNKAKTEKFITKFAAYYTPAVVIFALWIAVIPPLLGYGEFAVWLKRGLIFLVISCPCALVLSVPLGYFAGIGAASKKGILIKGANYMEALCEVKAAVFDKTGTLTKGNFTVKKINIQTGNQSLAELLVAAEYQSNHPIAKAIRAYFDMSIDENDISDYKEYAGKGVSLLYKGQQIKAGNAGFVGLSEADNKDGTTIVYLTLDGQFIGNCILSDEIKPESKAAIEQLKELGIKKTIMLTGDNDNAAIAVAKEVGIDEVKANLLPDEKVKAYKEIKSDGKIMYAGDGINDAPVLALADVGISMGALGSDAAIEAADAVIMTDNLMELVKAIKLSKYTKKIIIQNIIFVLFVKLFFLALGALGIATMGEAVFADVGTALIATLNSMRILKYKP